MGLLSFKKEQPGIDLDFDKDFKNKMESLSDKLLEKREQIDRILPSTQRMINNFLKHREIKKYLNELNSYIRENIKSQKDVERYQEAFSKASKELKDNLNIYVTLYDNKYKNPDKYFENKYFESDLKVDIEGVDIASLASEHYTDSADMYDGDDFYDANIIKLPHKTEELVKGKSMSDAKYEHMFDTLKEINSMKQPELNEMLLEKLKVYINKVIDVYKDLKYSNNSR